MSNQQYYLSVFASFTTEEEREEWFNKHVQGQTVPMGGKIVGHSLEDERLNRERVTNLLITLEALEKVFSQYPYDEGGLEVLEHEQYSSIPITWEDLQQIRKTISTITGEKFNYDLKKHSVESA